MHGIFPHAAVCCNMAHPLMDMDMRMRACRAAQMRKLQHAVAKGYFSSKKIPAAMAAY
jgi:hypothetical protein